MKKYYPKKANNSCFLKKCLSFILSGAVTLPLLVPGNMSDNKAETVHVARVLM